jgi:hypothetical protein
MSFISWIKILIALIIDHTKPGSIGRAERVPALSLDAGTHVVCSGLRLFETTICVSGLYADTKEMRPESPHEVDRLSGEPN